nr:anion permease [Cupriavidus sp. P-10]
MPAPAGLETKAWQTFAVFVTTIVGIMTAPLPMSADRFDITNKLAKGVGIIHARKGRNPC